MGVSIASRWPLAEVHEVNLHLTPRTANFGCMTLVTEIRVPEPFGPLLFVNHNPNYQLDYELERELQAVTAARFIEELVGECTLHVVLGVTSMLVPNRPACAYGVAASHWAG